MDELVIALAIFNAFATYCWAIVIGVFIRGLLNK